MNNSIEKTGYRLLMESASLPKPDLERLFRESESTESSFSQLLVKSGLIKESELLKIYANGFGIPFINLKSVHCDKSLITKIPVKFASYYKFFPIKLENKKLTIAISRLIDQNALDEIRFGLGFEIETAFAPEKDIDEMLKRHYGLAAETVEKILLQGPGLPMTSAPTSAVEVQDIEKLAETASVVQLVNQIMLEAYRKRASDIHLEPYRGKVRLRYRIDGVLREQPVAPEMNKFFMSILSRIKIMANLNIVERRLPQDGKARVKTQDETLDLRISCIPTPHGESMVIRILPSGKILDLNQVGLEAENLKIFQELIQKPHGIIFLTGPTGSGKSTTLYAGLNAMNTMERKIITIEDPIEYEIEGISQLQVIPDIGLTFARGLRSMLRHDPDVMMVGEVRDLETADIAIRVALTGHLILSTLHTNDAASGVTRLLDIGLEPFLVASSVIAFVAQRLVRVICVHCKQEDSHVIDGVDKMIVRDLGLPSSKEIKIYKGRGCDECNGSGYSGRIAIHELLVINEPIRQLIFKRASAEEIKRKSIELGMMTLRQDGWKKVLRGVTTPSEIIQVTSADEWIKRETAEPAAEANLASKPEITRITVREVSKKEESEPSEDVLPERRSYQRIKIEVPIKYRLIDENRDDPGSDWRQGLRVEDVSASGVAFLSHDHLKVHTIIELKIELPGSDKPVQCVGRIVRIESTKERSPFGAEHLYKIAVTFLAIPHQDRLRIENFCKVAKWE